MGPNSTNFRYLNRGGTWPDFHWDGLELRPDGALQLISLPLFQGQVPDSVAGIPTPGGPAGIAVDWDGGVYYSDPAGDRIYCMEGCYGTTAAAPCMGGAGSAETQFQAPRGLLISQHRRALFVADSGNHRIQIFDPATCQLLDTWGDGTLATPWSLAADAEGSVYVADYGNQSVVKFTISGDPDPSFWQNVKASGLIAAPVAVAVSDSVFILDATANRVCEFQLNGTPVLDGSHLPVTVAWAGMQKPMCLAVAGDRLYIGDNGLRGILQFNRKNGGFVFAGEAVGYTGPVAALAFAANGDLLVHTGTSMAPIHLAAGSGYGPRGTLWSKAISKSGLKPAWHELQAAVQLSGPEAHFQFFVRISDATGAPAVDPGGADPFPAPDWRPVGRDIADFFLGGPPSQFLWVAAVLTGDRLSTPAVSQIRVEFDHESYLAHLPEIYRETEPPSDFALRFLTLFESFFEEPEQAVDNMPALFDPQAVPAPYLPWLASWLALDLPGDANESAQRADIAGAFARYARRGTASGLRDALLTLAGVHAVIEEPILNAAWWRLPGVSAACNTGATGQTVWTDAATSVLGFTTGLAASAPQGAVVGTTTVLDQSRLITDEQLGEPLFDDLAYRFSVLVYPGEVSCAAKLAEVVSVLESEKPAHTVYHLCVVEPRMRVGFQARLGIDTLVGGPPVPTRLGDAPPDGAEMVLAGEPAALIGSSFVGQDAHL